ncbi:hypothetical protein L7F22_052495 [Adiantum nelumboides]|nr:hypothetical protein [Adiantum nelumboides]
MMEAQSRALKVYKKELDKKKQQTARLLKEANDLELKLRMKDQQVQKQEQRLKRMEKQLSKAQQNLNDMEYQFLNVQQAKVQMVRRCQSSPEIWAFLRSTYHHEDLITRVTALKKLLLAVLTEHQDISKFLDDWRTLLDNALLSSIFLDDSLQAMLLLTALPTSCRPFITTQASVVSLTVETLIARILQEDAMRGNSTPTTIPSSQYVQRQSNFRRRPFRRFNNTRNPVNNSTPVKICIHCGRHGHLVHECRTKRREQQRTDRRPRSQLQHIEVPALSQYGMESLQLFTSMLNSTRDLATSTDTSAE